METNQTPSTQQATDAAQILGQYFEGTGFDHLQANEEDVLHAFAQAGAKTSAQHGSKSANMRELSALVYLQEQTNWVMADIIDRARKAGESWADIGDALGVSRQAAQQKHAQAGF